MKDKKLNSLHLSTGKELDSILNQLADDLRLGVKKYGIKYKEPFWKHNKRLYNYVNRQMLSLRNKNLKLIQGKTKQAWDLANKQMDERVINYLKERDAMQLLESKVYSDYSKNIEFPNDVPLLADWTQSNISQYNAFLSRTENGLGLSKRIWKMSLKSRRMIEETLKSGILEGQSAAQMSRIFRQALKNPNKLFRRVRDKKTGKLRLSKPAKAFKPGTGVYRSSYQNAFRLARTEVNLAYRKAESERINQIPFIVGYEVHLSNAHPITDICDDMQGVYPKTFVFSGWHPACICYMTTILLDDKKFSKYLETGKISSDEYVKSIPNLAKSYLIKNNKKLQNLKSLPYWYRQNNNIIKKVV